MDIELTIQNRDVLYTPLVLDGITWQTERKGSPGQLQFSVLKDDIIDFQEGNRVSLKVDKKEVFFGYVFSKKRNNDKIIKVVAYDQLRYFKNKDIYQIEDVTASEFLKRVIYDFNLEEGEIEDTKYVMPPKLEDNTAIYDMILSALQSTCTHTGEHYTLFDDFGKISLKSIPSMKVDFLINENMAENFDYTSSIDSKTYNRVKLKNENAKEGERNIVSSDDPENMAKWGILQLFETVQEGANPKEQADGLLKLHNTKTRNLSISNVYGDLRVRAGCLITVDLGLGDMNLASHMLVESCKHTFETNAHFMDLTLIGGEFIV